MRNELRALRVPKLGATLSRVGGASVAAVAAAAAAGAKRHDAFQGYGSRAVPLLRQLLRAGGASDEGVAALRSDAPAT